MKNRPSAIAGPSQRQLRAGEVIRHALSEMFLRGEVHDEGLPESPVTISEVKASPDLRQATVYCSMLGRDDFADDIKALNRAAVPIRQVLAKKIALKFVPQLTFREDESFREAAKIASLLRERRQTD